MLYNAFVSYSHAADGKLGPALQSALHRFARRWYRLRAIRVFRDETNLSVSPGLWSSVETALRESEFLILLASPAAAASKWVRREVEYWLKNNSPDKLLLVITDGNIAWSDEAGDFDWGVTDSLPTNLQKIFEEEPKYTDLRWARTAERLSLKNPVFLDNVADLAARLHGADKDELIGEDIRQHRTVKRLVWSAVFTLAALTFVSIGAAWFAWQQKQQAERQRQIAVARQLTASAELARAERANLLPRSMLLAIESYRRIPSIETYQVLRTGLGLLPRAIRSVKSEPGTQFVALSSQGQFLATRHAGAIRVRSLTGDQLAGKSVPFGGNIRRSALTSDGAYLAVGEPEGARHVWNMTTGDGARDTLVRDRCRNAAGNAIAFSPDGEFVAAAIGDGTAIQVRRLTDGSVIYSTMTDKGCAYAVALSAHAKYLATYSLGDRQTVWIWDTAGGYGRPLVVPHFEVSIITFSEDGNYLATGSPDRTARVWEWRIGKEIALAQHNEAVHGVAFSPAEKHLATTSLDRTARAWEIPGGREIIRIAKDNWMSGVGFSEDGRHLVTASADGSADEWDISSAVEARRLEHRISVSPFTIGFSSSGPNLVLTGSDKTAEVWDVAAGTRVLQKRNVRAAALNPKGNLLATAAEDGSIRIWNVTSGDAIALPLGRPARGVNAMVFSRDGTRLAIAGQDGELRVWDMSAMRQVVSIPHQDSVSDAVLSDDGKRLLTLTRRGMLQEWQVETGTPGRPELTLNPPTRRHAKSISSDGRYVATWNRREQTLQVRDVTTGNNLASLRYDGEEYEPASTFSADGRYLATATRRDPRFKEGNTISVRELTSGVEVARITTADHVSDLAFNPDGKYLATVGFGRASLWRWQPKDLIELACHRLTRNLTREEFREYLADDPYKRTCPDLPE